MRLRQELLLIPLVLTAAAWLGCGPPPPPIHHVPGDLSGVYMGTHEIHFNITSPVGQVMRPEVRQGPIHVTYTGGTVQISLRLYENGEPCHLRGTQQAGTGRVIIDPGQRCSLRMLYDGQLVIAGMQINQGVADFEGYQLRTDMTGPFVAEGLVQGRRTSMQGNARIVFSGNRQASR